MLMHIKHNSLCLFILFWVNSVHMKTTCQFETSFWSKSQIWSYRKWNAYCLEFCFTSIHVSTNNEVTEQQSEISNWNEILYQFGVHSSFHLMWMYSFTVKINKDNRRHFSFNLKMRERILRDAFNHVSKYGL